MNETETRAEYIDPALKAAGWGVVEGSRIRMEFPINKGRLIGHGQRSKPDKADYVLQYKNRNLAVIEAKARDKYYTEGVGQAKDYAGKLQVRFTYSTNGLQIYRIDMQEGQEGDVTSYPTPDELWEMTFGEQNKLQPLSAVWRDKLLSVPFEDRGGTWQPRYYQENAITKVLEAVANDQQRILLTLATGTGKTAIAFQIAWKLFQAKWNINKDGQRSPRILFLADRNILADQAFNAFSVFEEDALVRINPSDIKKKGRVPKNGSVFFTIFQTFMSGPNDTPYFGEYPKDFFDFIIIDECHRGGANDESSWRAIMEYFSPAVQLGLTATPKRTINADTYNYFGEPVYVYSLKEGINDGFLTPFKVKQIDTTIDEYLFTSDDTVLEGEIEEGKRYTEAEMNRIIEIKEREEYRVKIFMSLINQSEKTLVFCATQLHALAIRDLINQYAETNNPNYCHRVTAHDGKLGEQHLRDFQDNEKSIPTILTTSQKLSTGVDAPEVRNIVLLRPVNSMIEFKQIIGRGTRLFDGKDYFTIYDFVKAHHHFSDPEWDGEPEEPETPTPRPQPQTCDVCGHRPCICAQEPPPEPCPVCGYSYCRCDNPPRRMVKVKLADGKVRQFQHMVSTSFYSPDGRPISAEEFLQSLFGTLPELFKSEDELRTIWSKPDTRKKLLEELTEKGFAKQQLTEFQKILNAENSDLYDVLAYIAFHSDILERTDRADRAKIHLDNYDPKQQEFLNFVLSQYVKQGVEELDDTKIGDLLVLKYHAIADAKKVLGDIATIRNTFIGFQTYLYDKRVAI
ncbi:EcoAI/FtnUII family type I restriction enzme subunit R [Sediminibacterium sp. C3]|uniref:EcoAI/FtnUII family type I restriction enzme subunit R n=1 Tax=Sediminibacterium sp. C3 TaxID=1267211 RepID=UPI000407ECC9|nr:type I restriction endonuclease subunit R [Sediminibacterium sp. C3]